MSDFCMITSDCSHIMQQAIEVPLWMRDDEFVYRRRRQFQRIADALVHLGRSVDRMHPARIRVLPPELEPKLKREVNAVDRLPQVANKRRRNGRLDRMAVDHRVGLQIEDDCAVRTERDAVQPRFLRNMQNAAHGPAGHHGEEPAC